MTAFKTLPWLLSFAMIVSCTPSSKLVVWVEPGSGRPVLRFGVGEVRGKRAPTELRWVLVRACASAENGRLTRGREMWSTSSTNGANLIDSTFVYSFPPAGHVNRHSAEPLDKGCYVIDVKSVSDSSRACFLVSNVGEVAVLNEGQQDCETVTSGDSVVAEWNRQRRDALKLN